MRTFKVDLKSSLSVGLCNTDPRTDSVGFSELVNLKTNGKYLISCPVQETVIADYPTVFVFTLGSNLFCATPTHIYQYVSGTWIQKKYYANLTNLRFLDFVGTGILCNGSQNIFVSTSTITKSNPDGFQIPLFNDSVVLNGQIVGAGVLDNTYDLTNESIMWSKIGSDCFTIDKQNTAGFYHGNIGECVKVLSLREGFIVMGTSGSFIMIYDQHTFAFRGINIPKIGSLHLGASIKDMVYYISENNELVVTGKNGDYTVLNYEWIMKDVIEMRTLERPNEVLFNTSDMSFILDKFGMYSYGFKIHGDSEIGLVVQSDFQQSTVAMTKSKVGLDSLGVVTSGEVGITDNKTESWITSGFVEINQVNTFGRAVLFNKQGVGKVKVTGDGIGFRAVSSFEPNTRVTDMYIELSKIDRRVGTGVTLR